MSDENYELDIDPKKVCRICLSQSNRLQNIFSNSIVDGYILSIPEIIAYAIDIDVQTGDNLPRKICSDCKQQVISIYTFKQKSKRIEKSLHSMFAKDDEVSVNVKQEAPVEVIDDQQSIAEKIICASCQTAWDSEQEFYEHLQEEHGEYDIEIDHETESEQQEIIELMVAEDGDIAEADVHEIESVLSNQVVLSAQKPNTYQEQLKKEHLAQVMKSKPIGSKSPVKTKPQHNEPSPRIPRSKQLNVAAKSSSVKSTRNSRKEQGRRIIIETDDGSQMEFEEESRVESMESPDEYECYLCALTFIEKQEYIDHCKTHGFYCELCYKVVNDENELKEHMNEHLDQDEGHGDELFCGPCNKRLRSSAQVEQHTKMHGAMGEIISHLDFYPCHECSIIFISGDRLHAHLCEQHGTNANIKEQKLSGLEKIDETCTDYQFLDEDKEEEYQDAPYKCGHCGVIYQSATELKYHVMVHAEKFSCPYADCGCQYDQLSRLSIHVLNKHINTINNQCSHCQMLFGSYDDLQYHLKNDCKERKYACHECDKKFFSKKALTTHLRTLSEKRYKCEECGKTFKQQGELTIHSRTHTNERPFQCTICFKSYKTSSMRAAHMDSHIEGKTFECTLCDKKLQSRTSYRNHLKRHTEEKKHICQSCGKKFFTGYHLRLHASKVHQKAKK